MAITVEPRPVIHSVSEPGRGLPVAVDGLQEGFSSVLDLVGHPMLICCLISRRIIAASPTAWQLAAHDSYSWSDQSLWAWCEAAFGGALADFLDRELSPASAGGWSRQDLTARDGREYRWQWRMLGHPEAEAPLAILAFYECRVRDNQADWLPDYAQDELTGLASRGALFRWAQDNSERMADGLWCAVFFLDLDDFKAVNDQFGHLEGDRVLRTVAQRLTASLRPSDLVVRYGGDEFVAVVAGIETPQEADRIATRISARLSQPIQLQRHSDSSNEHVETRIIVGVSLGVSLAQGQFDFERLLNDADRSMYRAKDRNRGLPPR